ncbi:FAD-dependent oxidoreductase [Flavisolibacter sp. BT320]|nr:FAD-dependent oxidoreductase [Flavisolibacter longurius]
MSTHTKLPLLAALRKAFFLSQKSAATGKPLTELIEESRSNQLHRRRFIGDVAKAGVALSAAGLLQGCRKAADLFEAPPPVLPEPAYRKSQPSIVILGAGIAGLNCAYQLQKSGYAATVYEASGRVGGRIWTEKGVIAPGVTTELGGEFIDTEHKDMLQLCHAFGLPLLDTLSKEEASLLRDSFYINGRFYTEEEVILAFAPYQKRIAADIRSLPAEMTFEDHRAPTAHFDHLSISAYLDSIGMTGFLRTGIEVAYLTEYGLENSLQSSINFLYLFSANTAQGFQIFGSSDERYKIKGGNQRVTDALYERVKSNVHTGHELLRIKEKSSGYELLFRTGGSTVSVAADMVVCTLPFSVLRHLELQVALPDWKTNAIQNLGYGTNAKLFLGFSDRVWRRQGHSAYVFTDSHIQTGWDNTQLQEGTAGGFTVYQGGIKGVQLGEGSPQAQAPKFVAQLEKLWPGCAASYTGVAKRMQWPDYTYAKGSYACYTVGQYTTIRGAEGKAVGNLFFAGEHCSAYFQGFMNGAAETGRMAAEEVVKAVKKKRVAVMEGVGIN